jgi:hypothetical protein
MTTSTALKQPPLGDEEIAEWLKANPEFFRRNGDLLAALRLPHSTGVAVSLIERQVEVLREKNQTAESRLAELVTIARSNEQLAAKIPAARRLICAPTRCAVLRRSKCFREEFDTGHRAVAVQGQRGVGADLRFVRHVSADDSNLNGFENLLATGRPRCGQIRDSQREFIFGPDSASIGSVALVPLAGADASAGLLVWAA